MKICSGCGEPIKDDIFICAKCGKEINTTVCCPSCGGKNIGIACFCNFCGQKLIKESQEHTSFDNGESDPADSCENDIDHIDVAASYSAIPPTQLIMTPASVFHLKK